MMVIISRAAAAAALIALCGVLIRQGGYYDTALYLWEIALYSCWGAAEAASAWSARKDHGRRLPVNGTGDVFGSPGFWLLILAAAYALRLMLPGAPASVMGTVNEALRFAAYGLFALMLDRGSAAAGMRARLTAVLSAAGSLLAIGSLAGWLGWFRYPSFVMVSGDERLAALGARLGGFLQYANANGVLLAVVGLHAVIQLAGTGGGRPRAAGTAAGGSRDWYRRYRYIPMLPALLVLPAGTALLLAESRGALLALGVGAVVAAAVLDRRARGKFAVHALWGGITSLAGYAAASDTAARLWTSAEGAAAGIPAGGPDVPSTAAQLGLWAVAVLGHTLIMRAAEEPIGSRSRSITAGLAALCGAGLLAYAAAALAPLLAGGGRLTGDMDTAAARSLFYRDGLALWADSPWIGYGGGAWHALYTFAQSEPYAGSEVHSGYLDIALDLGLLGILPLIGFVLALIYRVWRHGRTAGLAPITVLLVHAAVDVDLNYMFVWLLLLTLGACYGTAPLPTAVTAAAGAPAAGQAAPLRGRASRLPLRRLAAGAAALTLAAALLAAAGTAWRLHDARAARLTAAAAQDSAAREATLREALEANPAWTRIRLELAPHAPADARAALLAAGLRYEPQSAPLFAALGRDAAEHGDARAAAGYWRRAIELDRFDKAKQTEAVEALARLAQAAWAAGREPDARYAAEAALAQFDAYDTLVRDTLARGRSANGRRFAMTAEAEQAAAECRALLAALKHK